MKEIEDEKEKSTSTNSLQLSLSRNTIKSENSSLKNEASELNNYSPFEDNEIIFNYENTFENLFYMEKLNEKIKKNERKFSLDQYINDNFQISNCSSQLNKEHTFGFPNENLFNL